MNGGMRGVLAASGPASLLTAAVILIDGCPGMAFGFLLGDAAILVAFGDMDCLALRTPTFVVSSKFADGVGTMVFDRRS